MIKQRKHVITEYVSWELLWMFLWELPNYCTVDVTRYIFDYFCLLCCQEDHSFANGALVARRLFATKLKYRVKRCKFCGDAQYMDTFQQHKLNRTHRFRLTPGEIASYLGLLEDEYFRYSKLNSIKFDAKKEEKHTLSNLLSIYGWDLQDTPYEAALIPFLQSEETEFEQGIKRRRESANIPMYKRQRIQ